MKTKVLEEDLELLILRYGEQCSFGDKDTRRKAREVIVDYVKKSLTKHTEEVQQTTIDDVIKDIEEYAGHIQNDGSGRAMVISADSAIEDIIKQLKQKKDITLT